MTQAVLSDRQREVLKVVIQDYVLTAEPVGSRAISKRYISSLSPATIRNTMADLEEMGFLYQPHTSAGRVPTDKGYRVYVDSLMERRSLTRAEVSRIHELMQLSWEINELMRETSRILSNLSCYTAIVFAPRLAKNALRRIEFVHLHRERILAVLKAESGFTQHKVIATDEVLTQEELDRISRYLNELIEGLTLQQVREVLVAKMAEEKARFDQLMRRALELGKKSVEGGEETEVFIGGAANIVTQPEFADVSTMRQLFTALEEKSKLVKILDQVLTAKDFRIIIGSENTIREMQALSVIASPYQAGEQLIGALGVMGPTRIEYAKMVALVGFTAKLLSKLLTGQEV
ncbi:MAG: heat-inducible transcription repressor HrcA [candidate division NC10 bacterium]|nr:heat-inducible transcription repressor HrcA [candidate division NC10 bacterium]